MKLERDLEHQVKAVQSVADVLEDVDIIRDSKLANESNPLIDFSSAQITENINKIQKGNNIPTEMREYAKPEDYLNIDVKMETGTGKTFVQVKTIYELNRLYGFTKFIIVVPTLPIKAGTRQFIESSDTRQFFEDEYDGVEIELQLVESLKNSGKKAKENFPSNINSFVSAPAVNTNKIQVMLINSQLITNGTMLTKDYTRTFFNDITKADEAIQSVHPILLIDEAHKFDRQNTTYSKIIERLKPQCIIRFGATFPEKKKGTGNRKVKEVNLNTNNKDYQNLVYNLNSIEAFNQNLVKGVIAEFVPAPSKLNQNVRIKLISVKNKENCTFQKIEGETKRSYELEKGDSLSIVHDDFGGVEIMEIHKNSIELSNGVEVTSGMELVPENYSYSYQDLMMEVAINRHFETEEKNFKKGIKTLALFFIDDISAYRDTPGKDAYLKNSFERMLKEKLEKKIITTDNPEYKEYLEASLKDIGACHAGYFSQDNSDSDEEIYKEVNDILNNKEKLLKIKDDAGKFNLRRFIFSKWTLKEGWDNPNIFTIAKLRSSGSETSKLQEVGRGLRLPVDSNLNRLSGGEYYLNYIVDFTENNFVQKLTNEVNEDAPKFSYLSAEQIAEFATVLKKDPTKLNIELMENRIVDFSGKVLDLDKFFALYPELSTELHKDKIIDRTNKDKGKIKVREGNYKEIKKLWEKLNEKYIIKYGEFSNEEIEDELINILNSDETFNQEYVITERYSMKAGDNKFSVESESGMDVKTNRTLSYNDFIIKLSDATNIPITNIHNAFVKYNKEHKLDKSNFNYTVLNNLKVKIKKWESENLFKRFTYKKADLPVHPTALTNDDGSISDNIVLGNVGTTTEDGDPQEKYLYDTIAYDSSIEREDILEEIDEVTVFGKIPKRSIQIPIPTGETYSPDFMYLVKKTDGTPELNLIIESKQVESEGELRGIPEQKKIDCAKKFFKQLEDEGINIKYQTQLKNNSVGAIIKSLL